MAETFAVNNEVSASPVSNYQQRIGEHSLNRLFFSSSLLLKSYYFILTSATSQSIFLTVQDDEELLTHPQHHFPRSIVF
jgi:hypothetical protein